MGAITLESELFLPSRPAGTKLALRLASKFRPEDYSYVVAKGLFEKQSAPLFLDAVEPGVNRRQPIRGSKPQHGAASARERLRSLENGAVV
jgi:hypothetical protein